MTDQTSTTTDAHQLMSAVLDELLERHPEWATILGDHRYDDRLGDQSRAGRAEELAWAGRRLADLESVDDDALAVADRVDVEIVRNALRSRRAGPRVAARHRVGRPRRQPRHGDLHLAGARLRTARRPAAVGRRSAGRGAGAAAPGARHAGGDAAGARRDGDRAVHRHPDPARDRARARPGRGAVAARRGRAGPRRRRGRAGRAPRLAAGRGSTTPTGDPRLGAELFSRKLALTLDTRQRRRCGARPGRGRPRTGRGADRGDRRAARHRRRRRPGAPGARPAGRRGPRRRRHHRRALRRRDGARPPSSCARTTSSPCTTTRSRSS